MASLLGYHVVASEVEVGAAYTGLVLVEALQQQAEWHFGWPYQVIELGPRTVTPLPPGESRPKGGFTVEKLGRDIEAHLVDQAVLTVRPSEGRGTVSLAVVRDNAKREPSGGKERRRRLPYRTDRTGGRSHLPRCRYIVDVDVEVATGRSGAEALHPQERVPFSGTSVANSPDDPLVGDNVDLVSSCQNEQPAANPSDGRSMKAVSQRTATGPG